MFEILKHLLGGQHQFASDRLLLMLVGGAGVYLRAIPERCWDWFVGQTTMSITVKDDDAAFVWVKEWFLEQKFLARIRRVDLDTTLLDERPALVPRRADTGSGTLAGRLSSTSIARTKEKPRATPYRMVHLRYARPQTNFPATVRAPHR
ncbi:MAG: hypothetical protein ABSG69_16470 [Candidatus Acidiferrum sp.]